MAVFFKAFFTQPHSLHVNFLYIRRGAHHAFKVVAVIKTERMAELVYQFFDHARFELRVVRGQALEFVPQPHGGNDRTRTAQLRLAEDEGQHGDEQVHVYQGDEFFLGRIGGRSLPYQFV